jgi:uncharacterized protein DUF3300/endosialidase-like protein
MMRSIALALAIILVPIGAMAQTSTPPAGTSTTQLLKPAELDQLVAPIALYPDSLLSEVLMASAYPLDVVHAERWVQANKNLKGDALKAAVDTQPWDQSVKSLVATPSVLEMMSTQLDWTQKLGDAVVAQQADVMDAVQRLRAKAQANNKLTSTKEQTVTAEQAQGKQVIAIAPTQSDTVYVPYYDPAVVYGAWPYADYPPYYFGAPPYLGAYLATGLAFGAAYALGRWGGYWNGGVNWNSNNITVNRAGAGAGNRWQPNVAHHNRQAGNRGGRGRGNLGQGLGGGGNLGQGLGGRGNLGQHHRPSHRPAAGHRPSGGHNVAHRGGRGSGVGAGGGRGGHHVAHRGGRGGGVGAGGGRGGHHVAHRGGRGGGGMHARGGFRGGGGMHRGGGRGGGGRGGRGGRRSDIRLKHDIVLIGRLDDGLGFYRFSYNGGSKAYVGVMAQEVQQVVPQAVGRGPDGYLTVSYDKLGLKFESYDQWIREGAQIPATTRIDIHQAQ